MVTLKNLSVCDVFVCVNGAEHFLTSGQELKLSTVGMTNVLLRHSYHSSCVTDDELVKEYRDVSLISAITASYTPPPFELVMNTLCLLNLPNEGEVGIVRQRLRASPDCSYDRLEFVCSPNIICDEQYFVPEKGQYLLKHKMAVKKSNRLIKWLAIILSVLFLPISALIIFIALNNGILYFVVGILTLCVILAPLGVCYVLSAASTAAGQKLFSENFNSQIITEKYRKACINHDPTFVVD